VDKETKEEIKRLARKAEIRVAEAVLRWKYKKEGKEIPEDPDLQHQSQEVTDQARDIIRKRGKNILSEFKKAYRKGKTPEDERH